MLWPAPAPPALSPPGASEAFGDNTVQLAVTELGFEPHTEASTPRKPLTLVVTRQTDSTCATELVVPDAGVKVALPLHVPVTVRIVPPKSGRLRFGCGMQMMVSGVLLE
jgi:plastocyanin domain-containing protein